MKDLLKDFNFQKRLLWLNGLVPLLMLVLDLASGRLGANPPEAIIRTTGVVAILFLTLTLSVTPLAELFKLTWLIRHRRWLGLWSFYYACVHLLSYSVFDKGFRFSDIVQDIIKRPFILLGFAAFVLMIPLAVTSTNEMIRRLGNKNWKLLHRLTYLIAVFSVMHFWLIVKSDIFYPGIFAFLNIVLLSYRLLKLIKKTSLN